MQNAEKVLRFVMPSGDQELMKSYKVHTITFAALCTPWAIKNVQVLFWG